MRVLALGDLGLKGGQLNHKPGTQKDGLRALMQTPIRLNLHILGFRVSVTLTITVTSTIRVHGPRLESMRL